MHQNTSTLRLCASTIIVVAALQFLSGQAASAQSSPVNDNGDLPVISVKLTLADALRLADQNNVELEQSRATSLSAQADAERTRAALRPSVSTSTYATAGSEASIVTSSPSVMPQNIFGVPRSGFIDQDLMLMVPLTTGGALQNRVKGASSAASGAALDVDATRVQVAKMVTEAYTSVLLQNDLVASAESRVDAEQEQVRITQVKVTTGRLAPVDLLRELAELADAQSAAAQADANAAMAQVDLKTTLGISQTSTITLQDTLDSLLAAPTPTPATLGDAIHAALQNRPEIAAAQQRVRAASAQLSAAQGQYAPQIYAVGMADAMTGQETRGQSGYTVGLTASVPLYDGGARKADVDSARATLDRARSDLRSMQQSVEASVAQAWYSLQAAEQQVISARTGLAAAQQGYDLANLRYNAGKSTTAERLDALDALVRAQSATAQSNAMLVDAYAELRYSESSKQLYSRRSPEELDNTPSG